MRCIVNSVIASLLLAISAYGQESSTPLYNAILQSDLNAAGFKILTADLSDYAGTNLTWNVATNKFDATGGGGSGTVTSITAFTPIVASPATITTTGQISLDPFSQYNWDTAYTDRLKWDGGATDLVAATGRTSLGLVIGTNVAPATSGSSILYGNGSGGFSNVTIGTNLTFTGGTLNATGGGAPTTTDYLVGTADAGLSAEIVVGTSPGGELGGTWASPTIDDSLSVTSWTLVTPTIAAISNLTGNGFVKTSGSIGTLSVDTATYQASDADLTTYAGVTPTTVGLNFIDLANPSAITFPKITAGNDVVAESAATFRTSIGAGTGNGTVTDYSAGDLSPLFTTTEATTTTTPALSFALTSAAATTVFGRAAGTSGAPTYSSAPQFLKIGNLTTNGFVKTGSSDGTLSVDTATYLTANQSISLTGDVTGGPAATSIATTYNNAVPTAKAGVLTGGTTDQLLAKNSNTNYDLKWVTPAGGGNVSNSGTPTVDQLGIWVTATTIKGLTTLPATNFPALTGDVTTTAGALGTTIGANKVTLGMMATMATDSILGRKTASTGNVEVLTALPWADTGDVTRAADGSATVLAAGNAGNLNSGTLLAARMPAFTGEVTSAVGTVANTIADGITVANWTLTTPQIPAISNLTTNGFVKTGGAIGTLSVDTSTYLTTASASSTYQPLDTDLTSLAGITGVRGDVLFYGASGWARLGVGTSGQQLTTGGAGADPSWAAAGSGGGGDVVGPASATDNAVVRFDTTTGKLIQDSGLTVTDDPGSTDNVTLSFGANYNLPALMLYDGGATSRWGWGLRSGEMQFYGPSAGSGHFSWNKGGDFQTSGTNELMRLDMTGGVLTLGGTDTGIARNAAGVLEINNGTAGTYRDLKARNIDLQSSGIITGSGSVPTGGAAGEVLKKTSGTNYDVAWAADAGGGSGSPGGSTTQVQFNDGGAFGGDAGLLYNKTTDQIQISPSASAPGYSFVGDTSTGIWDHTSLGNLFFTTSGYHVFLLNNTTGRMINTMVLGWSSADVLSAAADTALARNAAGVIEVNNGTAGQYRDIKVDEVDAVTGYKLNGTTINLDYSNTSVTNQTPSTSDVYLAGSNIVLPAGGFKANGQYRCLFDVVKSAGTGGIVLTVRIGTAGTTGDTSRMTFTFTSGTSVADTGTMEVIVNWRTVGGGTSAVISGLCRAQKNTITAAGLWNTTSAALTIVGTVSGGFDSSAATTMGVSFNGGTAFAGTITTVQSNLFQK